MKRLIAILLSAVMLLSLVACSREKEPAKETEAREQNTALSSLSAKELYILAAEKTENLKSAKYQTEITLGGMVIERIESVRLREGYDGFAYSRKGNESIVITDGRVYVEHPLGNFSGEVTSRTAREYLDEYWYPLISLDPQLLSDFSKEEMSVSYRLDSEKTLALYASAISDLADVFFPQSATGVARITADGVIEEETITVSGIGENSGSAVNLVLKTKMAEFGKDSITVATPSSTYASVGDVRIPHLFFDAVANLENLGELQATLLSSLSLGDLNNKHSLHREVTHYRTDSETWYHSEQSLKKTSAGEEKLFYQALQSDGIRTEDEYDLILGELIQETVSEGKGNPWQATLESFLLKLEDLHDFSLSEDPEQMTVSFSVGEEKIAALLQNSLAAFPDYGEDLSQEAISGSGVFTISKETGVLTAFSVSVTSPRFTYQCSVTLDRTGNVELPGLQTPVVEESEPDGEGGEHDHAH